ncbi:MAG: hypothetical protein ABIN01_21285 [Ferruginibacter sp.]
MTSEIVTVGVTGYGDRIAEFLGAVPMVEVRIGDFVKVSFIGGMVFHTVRIAEIKSDEKEITLVFDWNGFRDGKPGGSLLADDVTMPIDGRCREVWRQPICDYCDKVAGLIQRDGTDILCTGCGREQYEYPKESLSPLTPETYRRRAV